MLTLPASIYQSVIGSFGNHLNATSVDDGYQIISEEAEMIGQDETHIIKFEIAE